LSLYSLGPVLDVRRKGGSLRYQREQQQILWLPKGQPSMKTVLVIEKMAEVGLFRLDQSGKYPKLVPLFEKASEEQCQAVFCPFKSTFVPARKQPNYLGLF